MNECRALYDLFQALDLAFVEQVLERSYRRKRVGRHSRSLLGQFKTKLFKRAARIEGYDELYRLIESEKDLRTSLDLDWREMKQDSETSQYRFIVLSVTWVAYCVASASRLSVPPLAPFMIPDLGLSRMELGLFYSFTYLGYTCAQLPAGWLADQSGVKWLLVIGQLALGLTSILISTVKDMFQGWFLVFMSGIGAGCLVVCTTKAVMAWFPAGERATAMGIQQTSLNFGGVGAAILTSRLALAYGWRSGFILLGVAAVVSSGVSLALFSC